MKKFMTARVAPLILIGMGILAIGLGGHTTYMTWASQNWPTVEGVVLDSSISKKTKIRRRRPDAFESRIVYEYTVDGIKYKNDRIRFQVFDMGSEESAEQTIEKYPVDEVTTIHYMADNPQESVLETDFIPSLLIAPGAGLGLLLVGLLLAVLIPKGIRKAEEEARIKRKRSPLY